MHQIRKCPKKEMVPSDLISSLVRNRHARYRTGVRSCRAPCLWTSRSPVLPVSGSMPPDAPRNHSERGCPLATAFRSPAAIFAYANSVTRSTFLTCCYACESYGLATRSAFRSTAKPGLPRFRLLLRFRPVAVSPSNSADRAFSFGSPSGLLSPSGSTLRLVSLPANPPSRAARSPFAPHSHFLFLGLAADHRSRPATAP